MRLRVAYYRLLGMRIGSPCWMQDVWVPRNPWEIEVERGTALDRHVTLLVTGTSRRHPKIIVRTGTYINRFTMIDASELVEIGQNCMIGPLCYITDHDHGHAPGELVSQQPLISAPVRIGENVWIGAAVVVVKGVTIGDRAVVGAGAVVTRDVAAGETVAGVPARRIDFQH